MTQNDGSTRSGGGTPVQTTTPVQTVTPVQTTNIIPVGNNPFEIIGIPLFSDSNTEGFLSIYEIPKIAFLTYQTFFQS